VLQDLGIGLEDARAEVLDRIGGEAKDAELLGTIGIDLDEVRRRAEDTFGPGALDRRARRWRPCDEGRIPFTPKAKKALELALREAEAMRDDSIDTEHLLLGLSRDGVAAEILAARHAPLSRLRARIVQLQSESGPAA
jgi:ATP-dependent Clp protease ATP-binding subunit ClpA